MRFQRLCFALIGVGFLTAGMVAGATATKTVRVAAASDLKFAFDEMVGEIRKENPDLQVQVTYGSSGNFFSQLQQKAPFDLFLSADIQYPRQLAEKGMAVKNSEFTYAVGRIVVWAPKDSKLKVEKQGMKVLLDPSIKKIAIANPAHAPYGRAAEAAMKKLGIYDKAKDKLVLGDNISQTAQFVESGAADVGIIALSLAVAPAMKDKGQYWEVPLDAYPTMEQGGVVLNWAQNPEATATVKAYLTGPKGQALLKQYGFYLPAGEGTVSDWAALQVTLRLAFSTTAVLLVIGLPLAYALASSRWRFKFILEALVALPILLPPTVLGFYILMATGPNSALGAMAQRLFGQALPFTFWGILVGSTFYNMPFAVRPFMAAFAAVDRRLVEASWSLGESRLSTFFRMILPLSWPGILTGMVLTFAHTVGEFGVVLMVGGNIPEVTRTLSITIYDHVQALDYSGAYAMAFSLLVFSFSVLCAMHWVQRKGLPL